MRRLPKLGVLATVCCLVPGAGMPDAAARAAATSSGPAATAPEQLVHAYPLGPHRLCCNGERATRPAVPSPQRRAQPAAPPGVGKGAGGLPAIILIVAGAMGALLLVAAANAVQRRRRRFALIAAHTGDGAPRLGLRPSLPTVAGGPVAGHDSPVAAAGEAAEVAYRRADEDGSASGAFNLGALLHGRGDVAGAAAAYRRAELRGDPDAPFNLGVLLYEACDLDGAEGAWRRCARNGHAKAAANLEFLLARRADRAGAQAARADAGRSQFAQPTANTSHRQ